MTSTRKPINGILLLDKPLGMTSNQALQKVKRLFKAKKAGHTGSLDPLATGMLPICFGEATKFSQFLLNADKAYYVVAKLGVRTTTGDREGDIVATDSVINVTSLRLEAVMQQFIGKTTQIPPMYSALKHQGKPLYELARKGLEIERKPREINIYSIKLNVFREDKFEFKVHCSKGTYIRTLVEDIGSALGCGSHVLELQREMVTPYQNNSMYALEDLEKRANSQDLESLNACLLPMETAVHSLPVVSLSTSAIYYLRTGQSVHASHQLTHSLVQLVSEEGHFLGIGEINKDGRIKPHRLVSLMPA